MTSSEPDLDVIVIGGGPGGSMTAGLLAKSGRRVAVVEREDFPRFHIGESMLAQSLSVLERAGVLPRVEDVGFTRKNGAAFIAHDGSQSARFDFSQADPPSGRGYAYQVDRATFDKLLLDWAEEQGAVVLRRSEAAAVHGRGAASNASVTCGDTTMRARFVVDACGLDSSSARLRGWNREPLVKDRVGLFGHFELARPAVEFAPGAETGDIVIVENANAWAWFIPLRNGVTSVGFVLSVEEFASLDGAAQEAKFESMALRMPVVREICRDAKRLSPIRGARSYGRSNGALHDDGVVLVGDAAGFLDPVFSSGICLALCSAETLAITLDRSLADPAGEAAQLAAYEARARRGFASMTPFVENWYDGSLKRVFYHPHPDPVVKRRITSLLAGELWNEANPLVREGAAWIRGIDQLLSADRRRGAATTAPRVD